MSNIEPLQRHPLHSTAAALQAVLNDIGSGRNGIKSQTFNASAELRPIVIYGLSDTRTACQAAVEQGVREVTFMSPTGVAHSRGPQWLKELLNNTSVMFSELEIIGILDCGPYEGHVMNALHSGMRHVHYTGEGEAAEKLNLIAEKTGAVIHHSFPEVLDLKGESDVMAACREWFKVKDLPGKGSLATQRV